MKKEKDNGGRQSKNERIEEYLQGKYNFRFNIVKSKPEFRAKNGNTPFIPVTKFALNSFKRELDTRIGVSTSADNLRAILESDFSPKVHPIREYFERLPRIDPDINRYSWQLSQTVTVSNPHKWVDYFVKWLIGVVANALHDIGCQNHTCLVLTGEQGKFKTTWLDHLCPESLQSYLFTGKIDPQNKDVLTLIAEYLFINIDGQDLIRDINRLLNELSYNGRIIIDKYSIFQNIVFCGDNKLYTSNLIKLRDKSSKDIVLIRSADNSEMETNLNYFDVGYLVEKILGLKSNEL